MRLMICLVKVERIVSVVIARRLADGAGGQAGRQRLERDDVGYEAIAVTRNRDEHVMLVGPQVQGLSERRDMTHDRGFLHDGFTPDGGEEEILFDDFSAMLQHEQEDVERARGERDELSVAPQEAARGVDDEGPEGVAPRAGRSGWHIHIQFEPERRRL